MRLTHLLTFFAVLIALNIGGQISVNAQDGENGLLLTVNDNGDSSDIDPGDRICANANGRCSLRAAIEESNADPTRNLIIFDLPQPAVIDLTLGELSITSDDLEIVGPGARKLTVQRSHAAGTPDFRIFHLPPLQISVNIRGITIRNGSDETGGGVFIEEGDTARLLDSAVSQNIADDGGGITNNGTMWISRCLISSNVSRNEGGGINNPLPASNLIITGSTLTDNHGAASGALDNRGTLHLINDTISHNSANGISSIYTFLLGTVKVLNTVIGPDIGQPYHALDGPFQSLGNNIVTNSEGSFGFVNGVNGDQVSVGNAINPLLGNLSNNGGQTDTLSLLSGSPAIDRGNDCALSGQCPGIYVFFSGSRDQRRYFRVLSGSHIDIGAFEFGATETQGTGTIVVGSFGGSVARYANSPVALIDPTTLKTRYCTYNLRGTIRFVNVPIGDVYVIHVKAKRRGNFAPFVLPGFD
jgi:hypothetical protein